MGLISRSFRLVAPEVMARANSLEGAIGCILFQELLCQPPVCTQSSPLLQEQGQRVIVYLAPGHIVLYLLDHALVMLIFFDDDAMVDSVDMQHR